MDKESWDTQDVYKAFLYTLPIRTNAHNIWDYVASVDGKTCIIDHYLVSYIQTRCTTVCFDSAESLDAVIKTMPVLKEANLCWSHFVSAKCAECEKLDHMLLACLIGGKKNVSFDKSRLAAIYAKCSASVAHPVSFSDVSWAQIAEKSSFSPSSEIKPTLLVFLELNDRFAVLEHSFTSLAEHIDMLAKRLDTPEPIPLVTPLSQNQEANIVISESLGVATGGETVVGVVVFNPIVILKMEETLNNLSITVISFLVKMNNAGLIWKVATCNVKGMNNPVKQNDIICWHKEKDNLVSIFTKSKLKEKVHPWIVNKFDKSGYLGASIVVVMNFSLARHVCKISEVSGQLLSIKLLFKNKLSVLILGLYAGVSLVTWFSQTGYINFLIAKAVNESFFVILDGDFNKNNIYMDQFLCVAKALDYILISLSLVNAIIDSSVASIKNYFNTNYKAVFASSEFKDATAANAVMFLDKFGSARRFSDLDAM
ncbi:hypothetical protein G9A89_009279 [Geosiphon pyriformis]|nr:hypothetical protein G9A89_009279 [Geosiphon pyriformis]